MKEKLRFLGLDVHAETIAVAVTEPEGEVRSLGTIPNRAESIRKLIKKPRTRRQLRKLPVHDVARRSGFITIASKPRISRRANGNGKCADSNLPGTHNVFSPSMIPSEICSV
jgi:hypothetical protein